MVAAALAHGVVPAHNVTLDLKNVYQTYADAARARNEFGFLRMWSIYPAQIQPIVDAMTPDFSEVARAAEILLAAQKAVVGPDPARRRPARPRDLPLLLGARAARQAVGPEAAGRGRERFLPGGLSEGSGQLAGLRL